MSCPQPQLSSLKAVLRSMAQTTRLNGHVMGRFDWYFQPLAAQDIHARPAGTPATLIIPDPVSAKTRLFASLARIWRNQLSTSEPLLHDHHDPRED